MTVCAGMRAATGPGSVWMRQAVIEVYPRWLPLPQEWTPEQTERHLVAETARLDRMASELSDQLVSTAIEDWTNRRGAHPDYMTTVRLRQTALQNAREAIVRRELYDLIEQQDDEDAEELVPVEAPLHQPVPASAVPWNRRWNDARYRSDPGQRIEALAEMVWPDPDFSEWFRIKAAYLLIARIEDRLAVPDGPGHRLASELAPLVYADLVADGYPER